MPTLRLPLAAAGLALLAAACAPEPGTPSTAALSSAKGTGPTAEPAGATSRDFGDHVIYFNALRTSDLTPEIAQAYDIIRSPNRVMLNVSISRKAAGTPGVAVAAAVTAEAVNLNAQYKNLSLREIREGDSVYYIGDVSISSDETLVFTISATPDGTTEPLVMKFTRDFSG
jgi:hypothetical protein